MLNGSSIFLRSLSDAGITHVFVNWGSDHPGLLEDLERQRVESGDGTTKPEIVTCPNEMVALNAAQGYAQVTGRIAAVVVHVDVGTQALGGAIHNVDKSRTPVLIYAGASPWSSFGEMKGSRNEFILWMQDVPDQSSIVRPYMRYTAQMEHPSVIPQIVKRAVQIATSAPQGPVYLWARREVMEQEISQSDFDALSIPRPIRSIEPTALSSSTVTTIAQALLTAISPLIITTFLGRNPSAFHALDDLCSLLAIPVINSCPTAVNLRFSHPCNACTSYLPPKKQIPYLSDADVILVIDCNLPWIPLTQKPKKDARVFFLDSGDPLKRDRISWVFEPDFEIVANVDGEIALKQIVGELKKLEPGFEREELNRPFMGRMRERMEVRRREHREMVERLDEKEALYPSPSSTPVRRRSTITVPNILSTLRHAIPSLVPSKSLSRTIFLNEGVTNHQAGWDHLRPEYPGSMFLAGGSSLGWALGASVGAKIGARTYGMNGEEGKEVELIVAIVGDGTFLFGVPGSVYWMARRYNTPFLTIVLNNGGWTAPKLSMLGVHPTGFGSQASGDRLTTGFGPECPDYAGIASAASGEWAWGRKVGAVVDETLTMEEDEKKIGGNGDGKRGDGKEGGREGTGKQRDGKQGNAQEELEEAIREGISKVLEEGRCAVLDCFLEAV